MFATGSMIKNRKINNIEDGFKHVQKLYLQHGFKITCIHSDSKFETLREETANLGISLNCASKEENIPEIEQLNKNL